jgi:hypothetical protein
MREGKPRNSYPGLLDEMGWEWNVFQLVLGSVEIVGRGDPNMKVMRSRNAHCRADGVFRVCVRGWRFLAPAHSTKGLSDAFSSPSSYFYRQPSDSSEDVELTPVNFDSLRFFFHFLSTHQVPNLRFPDLLGTRSSSLKASLSVRERTLPENCRRVSSKPDDLHWESSLGGCFKALQQQASSSNLVLNSNDSSQLHVLRQTGGSGHITNTVVVGSNAQNAEPYHSCHYLSYWVSSLLFVEKTG